jgi:hypothetical protein
MSNTSNTQFDSNGHFIDYNWHGERIVPVVSTDPFCLHYGFSSYSAKCRAQAIASNGLFKSEERVKNTEQKAQRVEHVKLIVSLYLAAYQESRPYRDAAADILAKTPYTGSAYFINLVEPKKNTRVKPKVKKPKSARRAKAGTQSTPHGQQGQQEAPEAPQDTTKQRIYKAFENLKAKVNGAQHEFYDNNGVAYKFVLRMVSKRMMDAGECAMDQHDVTNNILWELSRRNLDEIQDVHKYLCSAAKKQGGKAFLENLEDRKTHESVMVENEGEDGKIYMEDNPAMHGDVRYKHGGNPAFQESRPQFPRVLPEFIQGDNLKICQYIRENYTYERIAEILCMTVAAVKMRVAWMRKTIEEMQAAGEL